MNIEVGPILKGTPFNMRTRFAIDKSKINEGTYTGDYISITPK